MGATSAMYVSLQDEVDFEIHFIEWPAYAGEKTFSEVAQRIINDHSISDHDVVGGSSLGGMVALEIARMLEPKAVVLIGSATKPGEVQAFLSSLSPLAAVTPVALIQVLAGKHKSRVAQMFSESSADFIRAMSFYLPSWPGYEGPIDRIYRIHGRRDHVIPCPSNGAKIVDGAGHLIAMTHPKECGDFLRGLRDQLAE